MPIGYSGTVFAPVLRQWARLAARRPAILLTAAILLALCVLASLLSLIHI